MSKFHGVIELAPPQRHQEHNFVHKLVTKQIHLKAGEEYYILSHSERVALTGLNAGKVKVENMLFISDSSGKLLEGVYLTDIEADVSFEVALQQAKKWLSEQLSEVT